jgi:low affinity Fe/Cu permease
MTRRAFRKAVSNGAVAPRFLSIQERFRKFASCSSCCLGSPVSFLVACLLIVVWAATGPYFHFSDTWQLVINTGTTVITFLMVFLIQNTQNRDAKAIHLKLDELIRSIKGARNQLVSLESLSDEELAQLEKEFSSLRERSQRQPSKINGGSFRSEREPMGVGAKDA